MRLANPEKDHAPLTLELFSFFMKKVYTVYVGPPIHKCTKEQIIEKLCKYEFRGRFGRMHKKTICDNMSDEIKNDQDVILIMKLL